jgi:hypothetical protein
MPLTIPRNPRAIEALIAQAGRDPLPVLGPPFGRLFLFAVLGWIGQDLAYWVNAYLIRETEARPLPLHVRRSTAHRMVVPGEGATRAQ